MTIRVSGGTLLKAILGVVLFCACLAYLAPKWEQLELGSRITSIHMRWVLLAAVPATLHYVVVFYLWLRLLQALGAHPALTPAIRAYVLSLLPKYVPGKFVSPGVRGALAFHAQVPAPTVSSSLFLEGILGLASAAIIAGLGLWLGSTSSLRDATQWLLLAFSAGVLGLALVAGTPAFGSRWKRWTGVSQIVARPSSVLGILALYTGSWILPALSHWSLAQALYPIPARELFPLMVALAVSWGIGALSILAPAGLGVREGVLYLFIRGWMPEAEALLFVTVSRLLSFGIELLLSASWTIYAVIRFRQREPTASG